MSLYWLGTDGGTDFPPVERALREPNGLLAAGGDLSERRLLAAYAHGVFPWYSAGQPILWWSPDPRMVLRPADIHVSRSLRKALCREDWRISINRDFAAVIAGCAAPRHSELETWITPEMTDAYCALHTAGWAHSVEVWQGDVLVGGIYGVAFGRVFCGESMFHRRSNGSKVALLALCRHLEHDRFELLDCQMHTAHLATLGASEIRRVEYLDVLRRQAQPLKAWQPALTYCSGGDLLR